MTQENSHASTEYGVVSDQLMNLDNWSHQFVALYFAFTAALLGFAGYIEFGSEQASNIVIQITDSTAYRARTLVTLTLAVLGLLLTIWAISMLLVFAARATTMIDRLKAVEVRLFGENDGKGAFAHGRDRVNSAFVGRFQFATTAAFMVVMTLFWGAIAVFAMVSPV